MGPPIDFGRVPHLDAVKEGPELFTLRCDGGHGSTGELDGRPTSREIERVEPVLGGDEYQ